MERQEDMQARANIAAVATVVIVIGAFYTSNLQMLWAAALTGLVAGGCWLRSTALAAAERLQDARFAWNLEDFAVENKAEVRQHAPSAEVNSHHQQYGQPVHYASSLNWG